MLLLLLIDTIVITGTERDAAESAEPMSEDQPQASHLESASEPHFNEPHFNESGSTEQQDESEEQGEFQLSLFLGGDVAAETQHPAFGADSASNPEGFGVALDTEAGPMDESSPVPNADVTVESESRAAASMVP